jgi:signal transduction histidine kinase
LSALRNKAGADNPLSADIEALSAMTAEVVSDLRRFAGGFARKDQVAGRLMHSALRRHVQQAKQFYDIDIAIDIAGEARIGDRMAAAVLQLASEGINNICKHTEARNGALRIVCDNSWLRLEIENESADVPAPFIPRSITHRSSALGGTTTVGHSASGSTIVSIKIPV